MSIRFRVMGAARRQNPVIVGPNNQTEMRKVFTIDLLPIGANNEPISNQTGMPGMGPNGVVTITCETEQDAFMFADNAVVVLQPEAPAL
jgi:hypothetical protein